MKIKHYINGVPNHVQVAVSKWESVVDYVDANGKRYSTVIMDASAVATFAEQKGYEIEVVDLTAPAPTPKPAAKKPAAEKPAAKKPTAKE